MKKTLNYYHNLMEKIMNISIIIMVFSLLFGFFNFILTIPFDMADINDVDKIREQIEQKTYSFTNRIGEVKDLLILNVVTSIFNTIINIFYGIVGTITYLLFKKYYRGNIHY